MNENKEIFEKIIKIPSDMLIDIFSIIIKENIKHQVIGVIENRSLIEVQLWYDKNLSKHEKVMENIISLILDYQYYRSDENEELNWREN